MLTVPVGCCTTRLLRAPRSNGGQIKDQNVTGSESGEALLDLDKTRFLVPVTTDQSHSGHKQDR